MTEPDYKRRFDVSDFRGHFRWTKKMTKDLGGYLYHACHKDELIEILKNDSLVLRSHWSLKLPTHGVCKVPGVWTGLNYFVHGNHYGPFLIKFPLSVLNGKSFIAFRRKGDRHRYFFVQYEARIPIYSFKGDSWRKVNSKVYFDTSTNNSLSLKESAIYDVILTTEIPLRKIEVAPVNHPKCIPGKCSGISRVKARKMLEKIALRYVREEIYNEGFLDDYIKIFPDIDGLTLELEL